MHTPLRRFTCVVVVAFINVAAVAAAATADPLAPSGAGEGVWEVTLHAEQRGGCSRGFYNTDNHTMVRLDLRDPLTPTLTLDAQSLYTSGSFDGAHSTRYAPQWGRDLWTLQGALRDAPQGGTLSWELRVVSHSRWDIDGYPSAEALASPPQRTVTPTNADPDLTLTCAHQWLELSDTDRAVTLACTLRPHAGGDMGQPILLWAEVGAGEHALFLTQEAAGLEGAHSARFGTYEVTWRRPVPP
jgi:hypothetical protein